MTTPIREARWLVKVDDDTVLSTNRLKMLVDKLEMEEEEGAEVEEEIFCKHKKDSVLRPEDPKPYWVSHFKKYCMFHILNHPIYTQGGL